MSLIHAISNDHCLWNLLRRKTIVIIHVGPLILPTITVNNPSKKMFECSISCLCCPCEHVLTLAIELKKNVIKYLMFIII